MYAYEDEIKVKVETNKSTHNCSFSFFFFPSFLPLSIIEINQRVVLNLSRCGAKTRPIFFVELFLLFNRGTYKQTTNSLVVPCVLLRWFAEMRDWKHSCVTTLKVNEGGDDDALPCSLRYFHKFEEIYLLAICS